MLSIMGFFPVSLILLGFISSSLAINCYVCNSEIDPGCKKAEPKDLDKFVIDCNGKKDGTNNDFLVALYGDLCDGLWPTTITELLPNLSMKGTVKKGWTSVDGNLTPLEVLGTKGNGTGPPSLNQNHLFARLRKKGQKLLKMPPYNACRVLRISVPKSTYVTKTGETKTKNIPEDDPRVVRLCGWFNKDSNYNEETPSGPKIYKGKGGVVGARVCITDLCNGTTKFGLPLGTILLSVLISMFLAI